MLSKCWKADVKPLATKTGFKDISEESIESKFGSEINENDSILYYAFVQVEM
jgi:hypothetical protein